jgi:hypothetical protein
MSKKYSGNPWLPTVDVENNPLDFMPGANVMFSEHPLSSLAKKEPARAHEVMHRLLYLEHRKLSLEQRKAELACQMARFDRMADMHIEVIRNNPGHRSYTTKYSRGLLGLFGNEKIKTTIR